MHGQDKDAGIRLKIKMCYKLFTVPLLTDSESVSLCLNWCLFPTFGICFFFLCEGGEPVTGELFILEDIFGVSKPDILITVQTSSLQR